MKGLFGLAVGVLCLAGALGVPSHSQYLNHKVYRVTPEKARHLRFLQALNDREPIHSNFWSEPRALGLPVDIQVAPEHHDAFETALIDQEIPYHTMIHELQQHLADTAGPQHQKLTQKDLENYNFTYYLPFDEMMTWLDTKAEQCGARCELSTIGSTYEGRDIKVIKITNGDGSTKEGFWVDAGIHAREWVAPSTAMYFVERLINDFDGDSDVQTMLNSYDFYILVDLNADGYVYTHEEDRLWRKSRRPNTDVDSICYGTDINRNFGFEWGGVGTSTNPCSDTYRGPRAYSEVEAEVQDQYVKELISSGVTIKAFFTVHSYSQLWMTPWGYTEDFPEDYDKLMLAGGVGVEALEAVHGTEYTLGSASEILYGSSGTSRDWAKGDPQIEYVYTLELRDTGDYGFLLPPEQIIPTGEETWAGIKAFTLFIIDLSHDRM